MVVKSVTEDEKIIAFLSKTLRENKNSLEEKSLAYNIFKSQVSKLIPSINIITRTALAHARARNYLDDSLSMTNIGKNVNRSSATVKNQIDKHNHSIKRNAFCPTCKRAGGAHHLSLVSRRILKKGGLKNYDS
jgi:hypothetical protein